MWLTLKTSKTKNSVSKLRIILQENPYNSTVNSPTKKAWNVIQFSTHFLTQNMTSLSDNRTIVDNPVQISKNLNVFFHEHLRKFKIIFQRENILSYI